MKQEYTSDLTKTHPPLRQQKTGKESKGKPRTKKPEFHFKDLDDRPSKVKYHPRKDGFVIRTPAPNFGKALGMFFTILVPGFIFVYGPAAEQIDPFWPRIITGILMGIFFLAGVYCLLRKHEMVVKGDMFRLSTGIGLLSFRQSGRLSSIKSMWVQGKLRSAPHSSSYRFFIGGQELEEGKNKTFYLGLGLKSGPSIHALEGGSKIALQYIAFALQSAIKKLTK